MENEVGRKPFLVEWSAEILGAATVFSEDLAHGETYDGVTVLNPFLAGVEPPS